MQWNHDDNSVSYLHARQNTRHALSYLINEDVIILILLTGILKTRDVELPCQGESGLISDGSKVEMQFCGLYPPSILRCSVTLRSSWMQPTIVRLCEHV